jgi:hypothetical protein
VPVEPGCLPEEIYAWDPGEADPYATLDTARTLILRQKLIEPFRHEVPTDQRSMLRFRQALDELEQQLGSNDYDWGPTGQSAPAEAASERNPLEANVVLALQAHLHWICETFQNVPGASILIR